ncbi:hypothetical protein LVD17_27195 [Fulvivirga ulvae]|uniref:hypothetical protein n=1 Tax=Fulvivirga ulvae TaxID=2904245 RepID=UPI001F3F1D10|nr:hypothetical protein [Fulvivirga ulvae]UII31978.1 hypothetical protein LVD17_27195 [Fulvivirga ulvae]
MKIRCISDSVSPENSSPAIIKWANSSELEITIGKIYTVMAISKYYDVLFYYILSDESEEYPLAYPFNLFEICDSNLSKYWDTSLTQLKSTKDINIENGDIISFNEWSTKGDRFYENLLEEVNDEVRIFRHYRDKMLVE